MNPWHRFPFLRIFIPFFSGILLGINGLAYYSWLMSGLIMLLLLQLVLIQYTRKIISYPFRWIPGLIINLFLLIAGIYQGHQQFLPYRSNYYGKVLNPGQEQTWVIRITNPASEKSRSIKTSGKLIYLIDKQGIKNVTGDISLYFEKSVAAQELSQGDQLLVRTVFRPVSGPAIPATFDYAAFLKRKGILYQAYLKPPDWQYLTRDSTVKLSKLTWKWQQRLVKIIKEQELGKDEETVGCAMLLGYKEGFGQELQGAYSRAGVTHILSVSGLHVGMVFLVFNRVLFFLNKGKKTKLLKPVLLVLLTWMYAMLTGMSPSVQRAAFMFSFLILGQSLGRKNNIINTLFASALLLALFQPLIIFNYGFQLSYLAVLGIVCLEPILYGLLNISQYWLDKTWKLVAVTLAAQLATGPLAVLYFHQFPSWFIPANLTILPLATLVMYLGISLLLTSSIPTLGTVVLFAFGSSIRLMNYLVTLTDRLPYAVIDGLYPSTSMVILAFLFIVLLTAWISTSAKAWFIGSAVTLFLLALSFNINKLETTNRRSVFFFSFNGEDWAGINSKRALYLYGEDSCLRDSTTLLPALHAFLLKNRINKICWKSTSCLAMKSINDNKPYRQQAGWWITGKGKHPEISTLSTDNGSQIIIGSTLPYQQKRLWREACIRSGIPFTDLKSSGCFMLE